MIGKECYNCHGTGHYRAPAGMQDILKTVITGPPAGPTTENPANADKAAIPPADTGSPTTGVPAAVPPTHTDHLTAQEGTGKSPHQDFTRSVTLHLILTRVQKENYPQM